MCFNFYSTAIDADSWDKKKGARVFKKNPLIFTKISQLEMYV